MPSKFNQTFRSLLRAEFQAETTRARAIQQQFSALIRRGRKLRVAGAGQNSTKAVKLHDLGVKLNQRALSLREWTPAGNGRSLTLTLAFMNGTPYAKCEAVHRDNGPNFGQMAGYLKHCLQDAEKPQALELLQAWVKAGAK